MKINFSLYFRNFMTGAVIFLSLVILFISLPSFEDSLLEEIFDYDDEQGFYILIFIFCFIFFSYGIGMVLEIITNPYPFSSSLTKHLDKYLGIFTNKDAIIRKSKAYHALNRIEAKGEIDNSDVYKYMFSFVISRNENLSKEIQGCIFRIHVTMSLFFACIFLFLAFVVQLLFSDSDYSNALVFNIVLSIFFLLSIVVLYQAKQKSKMSLLNEIERAYYILTECKPIKNIKVSNDEKVEIEI